MKSNQQYAAEKTAMTLVMEIDRLYPSFLLSKESDYPDYLIKEKIQKANHFKTRIKEFLLDSTTYDVKDLLRQCDLIDEGSAQGKNSIVASRNALELYRSLLLEFIHQNKPAPAKQTALASFYDKVMAIIKFRRGKSFSEYSLILYSVILY